MTGGKAHEETAVGARVKGNCKKREKAAKISLASCGLGASISVRWQGGLRFEIGLATNDDDDDLIMGTGDEREVANAKTKVKWWHLYRVPNVHSTCGQSFRHVNM